MTLQEIKTESVTKLINGVGASVDIKESRVTVTSEGKVSEANGQVYDKQLGYAGSFNYSRFGGLNVNASNQQVSVMDISDDVIAYIKAVESEVEVINE